MGGILLSRVPSGFLKAAPSDNDIDWAVHNIPEAVGKYAILKDKSYISKISDWVVASELRTEVARDIYRYPMLEFHLEGELKESLNTLFHLIRTMKNLTSGGGKAKVEFAKLPILPVESTYLDVSLLGLDEDGNLELIAFYVGD